jgi:hypothetical protein
MLLFSATSSLFQRIQISTVQYHISHRQDVNQKQRRSSIQSRRIPLSSAPLRASHHQGRELPPNPSYRNLYPRALRPQIGHLSQTRRTKSPGKPTTRTSRKKPGPQRKTRLAVPRVLMSTLVMGIPAADRRARNSMVGRRRRGLG